MSAPNLIQTTLTGYLADISTAGQIYIPVPSGFDGDVIEIRAALNGAIATADATLTPKINGTAMTNGAIVMAQASSAAGDVGTSYPTAARTVAPGGTIEIETDGASTNTVAVTITLVISR